MNIPPLMKQIWGPMAACDLIEEWSGNMSVAMYNSGCSQYQDSFSIMEVKSHRYLAKYWDDLSTESTIHGASCVTVRRVSEPDTPRSIYVNVGCEAGNENEIRTRVLSLHDCPSDDCSGQCTQIQVNLICVSSF